MIGRRGSGAPGRPVAGRVPFGRFAGLTSALVAGCLGLAGCAISQGSQGRQAPDLPGGATVAAAGAGSPLSATVGERREAAQQAASPYANRVPADGAASYVPGEVIVGLAAGGKLPLDLGSFGKAQFAGEVQFTRKYALLRLPAGSDLEQTMAYLRGLPDVVSADRNYRAAPRSIPANDPLLPAQWAYEPKVADVYGAWSILDQQSASRLDDTVVAVVDSMADPSHPDLNVIDAYWSANALNAGSDVATTSFSSSFSDHGTGCAGVIGARKNNAAGAAGVVPGVPIVTIHVDDEYGNAPSFSLLRGLMIAGY